LITNKYILNQTLSLEDDILEPKGFFEVDFQGINLTMYFGGVAICKINDNQNSSFGKMY
jgi:hypothetical protein